MKHSTKQILVVLAALALTLSLVAVMAINTSAASVKTPVGTWAEYDTNHCEEDFSTSYPYTAPEGVLTNPDGSPRYEDDTEEPSTEGLTTEPMYETLELYCVLTITRADLEDALVETGMNQYYPGYSPEFTRAVNDLEVSDKPYTATVDTYSCIYPDQLVFTDSVEFYVRREGVVHFRCDAPSGSVFVRGDGIEIVPDVTYPTTLPDWTTVPFPETTPPSNPGTDPTVWTTTPSGNPDTDPTVWTSTPVDATSVPATQETTEKPTNVTLYCGDADLNGTINIVDATTIQQIISEQFNPSPLQRRLADVNGDGQINILDATCIQKYISEYTEGTGKVGEIADNA